MTAACQACTAPSPDAFLCRLCTSELRDMLKRLVEGPYVPAGAQGRTRSGGRWYIERRSPGLIENLADHAVGKSKLGEPGKRAKGHELPLRFNSRASDLMDDVRNTLTTWVRHVGEQRGVQPEMPRNGVPSNAGGRKSQSGDSHSPVRMAALWLAQNVQAISLDEAAGECHADVRRLVDAIERAIDRPNPPRFIGPCSTLVIDTDTHRQRECGTRLMAKREAGTVHCRTCHTEHDVERVINRLLANVDHWRFTREELIGSRDGAWQGIMGLLDEPVKRSTFYRWLKENELRPNGFRRPDGSNGVNRRSDEDEPIYRLSKVRQLRADMLRRQAAGMKNWVSA